MVAQLIQGVALNNRSPVGGMRNYDTNCVAMAFSKVLGIGVNATVNLLVSRGWVPDGIALENDGAILRIVAGLPLAEVTRDEKWSDLKLRMSTLAAGRYFACNTKAAKFNTPASNGHAFAIIRHANGGWGTAANNAERTGVSYASAIGESNSISVWGPA
ncbi:hypothetical protein [Polymorphobacter megasporae]|uniref:hypothetical protein n=1 Tax=Glacieibacterium megasporae TaxID=2835787 RepID=UPI001C1E33B3|nr:hypothetical protein [Polymorphobacter megasporae]UAJ11142.1 hypothetical protein KTC28_05390 [Polymorphobacter megasporae]